ncbi:MAG: hypothetical protein KGR26_14705, partial [Cyanobacteria bacterium REEB65]|nr:hypothetical protein [Cyanobacteria bacterium REEB65]
DSQPGTGQVRAVSERDSGGVIITAHPEDGTIKQEILRPSSVPAPRRTPSQLGNVAAVPAGIPVSNPDLPTIGPEDSSAAPMPIHEQPTRAVSRPNSAADRPVTSRPALLMPKVPVPEPSAPQIATPPALTRPMRTTPLPIPAKRPARNIPLATILIACSIALATIIALWYLHGKIGSKIERMQIGSEVSASVVAPTALVATPVAKGDNGNTATANDTAKDEPPAPVKVKPARHSLKKRDDSDDGDQRPAAPIKRKTDLKDPFSVN